MQNATTGADALANVDTSQGLTAVARSMVAAATAYETGKRLFAAYAARGAERSPLAIIAAYFEWSGDDAANSEPFSSFLDGWCAAADAAGVDLRVYLGVES